MPVQPNVSGPEITRASVSVFVVDDDPALVDSLTELLSDEGYSALGFTSPLDALARLRAGDRPGALLLDYVMPDMNGDEFLATLANAGVEVPVILLSGLSDPGLKGSVDAVLPKPFDLDRLLGELGRLLRRVQG